MIFKFRLLDRLINSYRIKIKNVDALTKTLQLLCDEVEELKKEIKGK